MKVAVIGAGVIGVTVAAELAQRGVAVTLFDQSGPGSGTSSTSYAWLNSNGKEPRAYYDLNLAGLDTHKRLSPTDETGWIGLGGHVEFAVDDAHCRDLASRVERLAPRDYGADIIDPVRACELVPDLRLPEGVKLVVHFTKEAYAYPAKYIAFMLNRARNAGAEIRTGAAVVQVKSTGAGAAVELEDGTAHPVDRVVSAVGRWTRAFTSAAGHTVPVKEFAQPGDVVVGYLATTNPLPVQLSRLVTSPWLNVRPAGGGRLMLQALDLDGTADPRVVPGPTSELAEKFLARLRAIMANAEGARIEEIVVGQRVMPDDGRTIVGPVPNVPWLYVVATHSGITLAPYLGAAVAEEVLGVKQDAFDEFRIERFLNDATYGQPYRPRKPGQQ